MTTKRGRRGFLGIGLGFIAALALCTAVAWVLFYPQNLRHAGEVQVVKVRGGWKFRAIADTLHRSGVIKNKTAFALAAKILRCEGRLKPGRYRIPIGLSNFAVLRMLSEGLTATERVTIPEGSTAFEIAALLQKTVEIDSARFMDLVHDSTLARQLGIVASSLEGYLFPETYQLHWGMSAKEVIGSMVNQFHRHFTDSMRARAKELGFTVHQVVTLASIIEGEAKLPEERTLISAVYHNRLKRGMLLQADPTLQYVIRDGPRRLYTNDLAIDSPYNTYRYPGLPPGAVSNPGLASILAALSPAPVDYLYFVAAGDGSHVFTSDLKSHLKAKARLDRLRRAEAQRKVEQRAYVSKKQSRKRRATTK